MDVFAVIITGTTDVDFVDFTYQPNIWGTAGSVDCALCGEFIEGHADLPDGDAGKAVQIALGRHLLNEHRDRLPGRLADMIRASDARPL